VAQTTPVQGGAVISRPGSANPTSLQPGNQQNQTALGLIGDQVQDRTGARLGTIRDLAFDLQSGRLVYALISDVGTAFHPVPPEALLLSATTGNLTLNLTKNDFNRAPSFQRQQIATTAGNEAQVRRIYQAYGQTWPPAGTTNTLSGTAPAAGLAQLGQLTLANDVIGRQVTNPQQEKIGEVSDFLLDLRNGQVTAAILRTLGFVSVEEKLFAVSPSAVQSVGPNEIVVNLTRANFEQAQPSAEQLAMTSALAQMPTTVFNYQRPAGSIAGNRPASMDLKSGQQATQLLNAKVNNQQGEILGTVKDFALDPASSRVVYVLVASQGATVHPVPPASFTVDPAQGNVLLLDVPRDQFDRSPSYQSQLPPTFSQDTQINQVYGYYHQQWQGRTGFQTGQVLPGARTLPPTGRAASNLNMASRFLGQNVTGSQQIPLGQISDLWLDLKSGNFAFIVGGLQNQTSGTAQ